MKNKQDEKITFTNGRSITFKPSPLRLLSLHASHYSFHLRVRHEDGWEQEEFGFDEDIKITAQKLIDLGNRLLREMAIE